jgi:hypothetical protein
MIDTASRKNPSRLNACSGQVLNERIAFIPSRSSFGNVCRGPWGSPARDAGRS